MSSVGRRVKIVNGITYLYDCTRSKYLSTSRAYLRSGIRHRKVTNQYMRVEDSQPTMTVGDDLPHNGTIVGLTANCEVPSTWVFEVYKKGTPTSIASLSLSSQASKEDETVDVDVSKGDVLLFKLNGVQIPFPRGMVEIAWRL